MWLLTPDGFYSVVNPSPNDSLFQRYGTPGDLCIRARAQGDLTRLRRLWCPELGKTIKTPKTRDYGFRAYAPADDVAKAMARITLAISYGNFKDEVRRKAGPKRERIYHRVWDVLTDIQYGPRLPSRLSAFGPIDLEDDWFDDPPSPDLIGSPGSL